ncbi:permease [Phreatobacter stygius]|uniref:Permease n=1 Tax=Phreatobacter stygius TaxID=1940610 RepID=A0A4D7AWF1_9HYPH|nr:permease [Phreatobacter stygius]QCI63293.1 permease [Phreatobacter stygius]
MTSASLTWFARQEMRLTWREWLWWLRGHRHGVLRAALFAVVALAGLHLIAGFSVASLASVADAPDRGRFLLLTAAAAMAWMLMLSQAMESVTRVLYARGDVDLILSSPAPARALFALRLAGIAAGSTAMAFLVVGPFVNMLAIKGGAQWLWAYGVLAAMSASAAALAILATLALFRIAGPQRTRLAAQIVAAVVGAAIVIGLQVVAIMGHQGLERFDVLRSEVVIAATPMLDSPVWWPVRAATGEVALVAGLLVAALALLGATIAGASRRFADLVIAASMTRTTGRGGARPARFVAVGPAGALRAKELKLLARDPWLLSQTLMQLLYLIPPALLLWQSFGKGANPAPLIVPVLVMAAGQLAGGLAWLAISGEDAPDLVATAPLSASAVLQAKIQAVLIAVALPMAPLVFAVALLSPAAAGIATVAILAAAASATAIQLLFKTTAKRAAFRRRQTASRVATFAEALVSIAWAAAAGLAAAGSPLIALVPVAAALGVLAIARTFAPSRA